MWREPRYQRPYCWSTKQWKPFWEDLKETARRRRRARRAAAQFGDDAARPPHQHFFGPIVQVPTGEVSRGVDLTRHYLIDGQQRLTTIIVLLHSLAEVYADVDPQNRDRHVKQIGLYTTNDPDLYPDPQHRTKVLPGRWDRDSFLGVVAGTGQPNGNIQAAQRFFANSLKLQVRGREQAEQLEELEGIFDAVRDGLLVACVFIGAGDNSWEIFRSLNDRGLPLSQFDNIRNLFFMKLAPLPEREVDDLYTNHWTTMEDEATGRHGGSLPAGVTEKDAGQSLTRFAHAWIQVKQKEQISTRDISDRFQALLDQPLNSPAGSATTVAAHTADQARVLHFDATAFRYIARPQSIGDDETRVRNAIRRAQCLGVQAAADPIMIELLDRYLHTSPRDIDGFLRCLHVVESWVVRRAVAGVTLKNHNRLLLEGLAVPVVIDRAVDTPLDELASAMRDHLLAPGRRNRADQWPDDEKFREGFFEDKKLFIGETKGFGGGRGFIRALLAALEADSQDGVSFDRAFGYQVEHVMPSELTSEWRSYVGPDCDRFHQDRVNTIGNLVLLTQPENARAGRGLFEQKRTVYRSSGLATVRELAAWQNWRKEDIDRRAGRLADAAIRIWQR